MPGLERLDAVVVGAGQAGLGVSHFLARAGIPHRVLERGRIGESWRSQRWDAFHMNTINAQTLMPGQRCCGAEPEGFMTHHGWVSLLEAFAATHRLPVESGTPVIEVTPEDGGYRVATPRGALLARNLVVASGGQNCPRTPALARTLQLGLRQVHTADYRNPATLPRGAVLVAGAGQSGCQIAADLLDAGRTVYLATCRVGRLPRRYRGRDIVVWMHACGIADARADELADPSSRYRGQPQIGPFRTISLQSLSARGAVLLGRLLGTEGGELRFADDLAENMRAADAASAEMKSTIDAWIARNGLEAPPPGPDPEEEAAPSLPDPPILALDPARAGISTVIWGTGFGGDFSWLRLGRVLDARGDPVHAAGVGRHPGLFYTGLPWLTARKSALVTGVAHDAPRIAALVAARCD